MAKKTYSEKLSDPRWQRKRLEILERDNFTCQRCDRADRQLHVHHSYYVKYRDPWLYPNWSLQTLCATCHKEEGILEEGEEPNFSEWEEIIRFMAGDSPDGVSCLWDLGVEVAKICNAGNRSEELANILFLLADYRKRLTSNESGVPK